MCGGLRVTSSNRRKLARLVVPHRRICRICLYSTISTHAPVQFDIRMTLIYQVADVVHDALLCGTPSGPLSRVSARSVPRKGARPSSAGGTTRNRACSIVIFLQYSQSANVNQAEHGAYQAAKYIPILNVLQAINGLKYFPTPVTACSSIDEAD